jgi:tetratricopeptide (TPR) repeat protein
LSIYDAFISYSHAKDKPIAAALQSVIQKLGKPWYRRRGLRVFRDDTSLSATPHLWPSIERALEQSRYLLLLASPESAASPWVGKEIDYWLTHKTADTLLIGVTDGTLDWDGKNGDFKWSTKAPLPKVLKGRFPAEPKWVDLCAYRNGADPRDARFLDLGADFAAAIHGMPKEDLLSQEVRQQKRALRLAVSAAGAMLVLVGFAGWQWKVATDQRDRAERTLNTATKTANSLVFDLAREFRNRAGMPLDLVRKILGRAQELQQQLRESGETAPELRQSEAIGLLDLVDALLPLGDTKGALAAAERSRAIWDDLAAFDPANEVVQRNLSISHNKIGDVLVAAGRRDEALKEYSKAEAIRQKLAAAGAGNGQSQRDLSVSHNKSGDILRAAGRLEEALTEYRKGLDIMAALVAGNPTNAAWRRDLSVSYTKAGDVLMSLNRPDEALVEYRKGLAIDKESAAADLDNTEAQRDFVVSQVKIGDVMLAGANPNGALTEYRKALAILKQLADSDSGNTEWQRDMTVVYSKIGDTLMAAGDQSGALAEYRDGIAILQKLATADQGNTDWQSDLSSAHTRAGSVLMRLGRRDEAVEEFRAAAAIDENLAKVDPHNARWQIDFVLSLWHLAADVGDRPRARYTRALEILRRLDSAGTLKAEQRGWISQIEQLLAQLPPERAEAKQ